MKLFLILISILFSVNAMSQSHLNGTYMTSKKDIGFESDLFHFRKDNSFDYAYFSCTGVGYGIGEYQITSDSLILEFNDCEYGNELLNVRRSGNDKTDLIINVHVTSLDDGSNLPGVNCYFLNRKIGTITNSEGKGTINTAKVNSVDTLKVQFVGLNSVWIPISPNDSHIDIEVQMTNDWVYESDQRIAFPIKSKGLFGLKLERFDSTTIKFNKISLKKGQKRLSGRTKFIIKN